jgi:hypothetical protein
MNNELRISILVSLRQGIFPYGINSYRALH